jgi:hypothetical protein
VSIGQHTRVGRLKIRVDRLIYTTITLLTVLIIYDGWEELRFWDVVTVIVGPILAISWATSSVRRSERGSHWAAR